MAMNRTLSFSSSADLVRAPKGYKGSFVPAGRVAVELYPIAIAAPQNIAKVEAAFKDELAKALKDGFLPAEIASAKSGAMQQRAQQRAQDGVVAGSWTGLMFTNRTFAFSQQFDDKLAALNADDLLAAVIAVQQLEGHILQPVIMRRAVSLHPIVILVALATGSAMLGIVGAFLSVPAAAVISAVGNELRLRSERNLLSDDTRTDAPPEPLGGPGKAEVPLAEVCADGANEPTDDAADEPG